jgi:hypothetical protein
MSRLRLIIGIAAIVLVFGVGGVAHAQDEPPGRDAPAVTIGDPAPVDDDTAWTFRFLVPTLLAMTAVGIGLTVAAYARGVKGRYRVSR